MIADSVEMLLRCATVRFCAAVAFGNVAFGNEIAQTDDCVIVEATRTFASPHNKQTKSWFVMETPI